LSEYKWNYLPTCKKDVISVLDKASKEVVNEMRNSPKHTLLYYNALSSLLDKVIVEIASRKIFNAPDDWYYSFEVSNRNARLYLKHIHDLIPAEKTDEADNENTRLNLMSASQSSITLLKASQLKNMQK
jgi:hypothetical protein